MASEEVQSQVDTTLQSYDRPLANITLLKYLGHIIKATNDIWSVAVTNLKKTRNKWSWISRILGQEGADARMSGIFFKVVVQEVFLFGLEMWAATPPIGRTLWVSTTVCTSR